MYVLFVADEYIQSTYMRTCVGSLSIMHTPSVVSGHGKCLQPLCVSKGVCIL